MHGKHINGNYIIMVVAISTWHLNESSNIRLGTQGKTLMKPLRRTEGLYYFTIMVKICKQKHTSLQHN